MKLKRWRDTACLVPITVAVVSCSRHDGRREPPPGVDRWVLIDKSVSTTAETQQAWAKYGPALASRLQLGDRMRVFGLHGSSGTGARLLDTVAAAPKKPGLRAKLLAKKGLKRARADAVDGLHRAFSAPANSRWTDILGALNRIARSTDGRPAQVIFFSDMLHSTPQLELAVALGKQDHTKLIATLLSANGLNAGDLKGTTFECVLPTTGPTDDRPSYGPELRAFWTELFAELGGELISFDTYLPDPRTTQ